MIRGHEGRLHGASDVRLLQLDQEGVNGTIVELNISGSLGILGATRAAAAGTLTIGGDLPRSLSVAGSIWGPLTIGGAVRKHQLSERWEH